MPRSKRKARPTPKGAASESVAHARTIAEELSKARTKFRDLDKFAYRFNDFLRAGRATLAVLPKEESVRAAAPVGKVTLAEAVETEIERAKASDPRFNHFLELKDVSAHDFTVKPDRGDATVTLLSGFRMRASVGLALADPAGQIVQRRGTVDTLASQRRRQPQSRSSILYFLNDWPTEDLITYCRKLVNTLDSLVKDIYARFP
jgi:hypothetical protein